MRISHIALFAALIFLTAAPGVRAGLDVEAPVPKGAQLELVVIEAPGCDYCDVFRRDVLPTYQASEQAKDVPIRFIDINDEAASEVGLNSPVNVVPTFVVLKNNREIGRIPGYTGPDVLFQAIKHLVTNSL